VVRPATLTAWQAPERVNQREKRDHDRAEPPLQASGRADADQLPHEEPEVEAARVE
jgi:hypothetical protein